MLPPLGCKKWTRSGQTCIELLYVVLGIATGVALASYLRIRWGWPGIPVGFICGAGAWYVGVPAFFRLVEWLRPISPRCRCGRGGFENYRHEKWLHNADGKSDGCIEVCKKCGARYLFKNWRFLEILPDGSFRPYMIAKPAIGWRPEEGPVEYLSEPGPPAPKTE